MKPYSSTTLNLYSKSCPYALTLEENGTHYDREYFHAGIAAHAVLQKVAEIKPKDERQLRLLADSVTETMLLHGRSYNGKHEPPMSPEAAFEGRDLAINWVLFNDMPAGETRAEIGLAIDADGNHTTYDANNARYRGILDLVYSDIEGDEEFSFPVCVVRDYKSAWPAGENELDTLQRKGQAVLAWRHKGLNDDWLGIRLEVCNLRTGMTHQKTIMLDEEGEALLAQWEKDILMLCRVADQAREARPGANCCGCRFVHACEYTDPGRYDIRDIATGFAVAQAIRDDLFAKAKLAITEGAIPCGGGTVGYKAQTRNKMRDDGHIALVSAWNAKIGNGAADPDPCVLSMVKALSLGSTSIDSISKVLYQERGAKTDREAFKSECMEEYTISQFGVWTSR